jgi:glycosyltransferase 2 family protein
VTRERRLSLLKTIPGLLISAFFLWWTFRGFKASDFKSVHLVAPLWILGILGFSIAGYTVRCFRWWRMLRSVNARFSACARVFMTSLAANNILPLRIGDVMRIFTYAGDLNATPSIILSTVILEKLLDIFTLAILFVVTMHFGKGVSAHLRVGAEIGIAVSSAGLLVLVFGARTLESLLKKLFARTQNPKLAKLEHWLLLALDCIRQIGVFGTLMLIVYSFVAWCFEGLLYVSAAHLVGLQTDWAGPWAAVAQANLSFLIPSSPGGIGPFEWACKQALMRYGATEAAGGIFGLLIHAWLLVSITAVGGGMFLQHRLHMARRKPLLEEIETLPVELP